MPAKGFTQDAQGRWFAIDRFGKRIYSPTTANRPRDTLLKTGAFNTATGEWERKTNWGNIVGLAAGGAALAPAAVAGMGALAGGAAGGGAAGGGAAGGGAAAASAPVAGGAAAATGGSVASGFGSGLLGKIFNNPLTAIAVNAGTGLYGAKMQADASSRAAEIQAQSAREALAFLKEQYGQAQANYKPYLDAGTSAVGRMSNQAANLPSPMSLLGRPQGVTLRAPTGETRTFAPNDPQIAQHLARGAERTS